MADNARRFVQKIAKKYGYLREEVYSRMDAETRRDVQEAFLIIEEMLGLSVITLAKNLYSKDVRFIFELLQNANDNHFQQAIASGAEPYVSFDVFRDSIVIDCNEDGFNESNIRAICNIGKSSKTGAQDYVGEKGIGFKSVFKVAWKVHIQSGYYSFTFTHRKGDSGIGMITPVWQEPTEQLTAPLTRMTLFLHGDDADGEGTTQRQSILQQLNELQPAMLLFVKNLKRINVRIHNEDGSVISSFLSARNTLQGSHRLLEKAHIENGQTTYTRQKYHVVESLARNLPGNENREYTAQEEATRAYSNAPVVLTFPLTDSDEPLIEPQEVFAFLPVRRVGFNFLIHSDFVTQANREDIVASSPRNIRLLDSVADSFIVAMREFCQHQTLRYEWMRYLPTLSGYPWDSFWQRLVDKIKDRIQNEEMLYLRNSSDLRRISEANRLDPDECDHHGNPLFDDLPGDEACYISPYYSDENLDILESYGLSSMYFEDLIERVRWDLLSPVSRMRSETDNAWHVRAAELLSLPFENGWSDIVAEVKELQLIPLLDETWVSPNGVATYFATTRGGLPIPADLGARLVKPAAARVPERKELFFHLGVKHFLIHDVRSSILQRYQSTGYLGINHTTSLTHLKFLYLTHTSSHPASTYSRLGLCNADGELYSLSQNTFYLIDTNPYGLSNLVAKVEPDKRPSWRNIHFLHRSYFENNPDKSDNHDLTWEQWLQECLCVRLYPRLVSRDGSTLSGELQFVSQSLPSDFLGFLRYCWDSEKSRLTPGTRNGVGLIKVPCRGGQMIALWDTYLPTTALLEKHDEYIRYGELFPFLQISNDPDQLFRWDFLKDIGVKADANLDFYFDMLNCMEENDSFPSNLVDPSRVPNLYIRLHSECTHSDNAIRESRLAKIREYFRENYAIYLPQCDGSPPSTWDSSEYILLDGPVCMRTTPPIYSLYLAAFPSPTFDLPILKKFFSEILQLPKCTWKNVAEAVQECKTNNWPVAEIKSLYEYLRGTKISGTASEQIKEMFEEDALIYADIGNQKWFKPSECLWSAPTSIRGKINLSTIYDAEMEKFFVEKLGVQRLDGAVVYNELLRLNVEEASVDQIKDLFWTLNSQLELAPLNKPAEDLLQKPILPIRNCNGQVTLNSSDVEFAIVDRDRLHDMFGGKMKLLDFTKNEICHLGALIKWAGLEDRYLSWMVKESSDLDSGVKIPISDPTQDVSKKAYGLLRIATHFKSPRIQGDGQEFYDLLRGLGTWETQGISTTFSVSIDGQTVSHKVDRGEIHIDDSDGLYIYLPYDEQRRDDSYLSVLPDCLAKWIMTDPAADQHGQINPSVSKLVQSILYGKVSQVNRCLDQQGIIEVSIPEQVHEDTLPEISSPTLATTPTAVSPSTPRAATPPSEPRTPIFDIEHLRLDASETPATYPRSYGIPSPGLSRTQSRSPFARENLSPEPFPEHASARILEEQAQEYIALLSHVISAGKRNRALTDTIDLCGLREALDGTEPRTFSERGLFGTDAFHSIERDKKVGAAGELFVFELLRAMSPALRGFTRANWTTTIRMYVTAHADYANMDSCSDNETSDLEYEDSHGTLTEVFINRKHLGPQWRGRHPKYYIEVKTTPGSKDTPFYMSDAQYKKMKRLSTDDSIYVIFRVFNLYTTKIGVDILVDPARLAEEGRLIFTAGKWTVRPVFSIKRST
ncbi:uncharacterized protein F4822DRAFT_413682 [Hypoxylon trugodes]|uniref:uncharacterized protein n=1 Tax=Hypoxylon trugodes TaxID=326681 RepID=UPI00219CC249|nr:uncharacterized protein F4822DRAFT_413682 [Hypoxylon trugodes]KAI1385608.1 hypothetical protein F4822DRAFT_413682 [Hypoxylon trugodes]